MNSAVVTTYQQMVCSKNMETCIRTAQQLHLLNDFQLQKHVQHYFKEFVDQ